MTLLVRAYLLDKYGPLLTEDQLAEVLHAEPGTLRNKRSAGLLGIPVVRHGQKPLFHIEDVANLIEEMREAGRLNR
ncbi:DNA-binding protein [Zoogloea oleivorans]|uniref:DNA-binding protein n=1 Tax=Zoogloea oleivorans TaxID=1552750 RepID=A0A6C2CKV1_9RHOO|nr:helix-turn-helix domain-containing protein [Zoogloea oleivorans]TYC54724.1 DNA-binding protein [Zoogloea oleivorans]